MKAMCPNLFTGQEHFPGSAQLLFPRSAECLTPQRVRRRFRVGRFARLRFLRERCGLGYLFSVAFAQAKGARRLRRFRGGQSWVCSECQGRGMVPTLKRPKGRAPAAFGVGTVNKYGLSQAALRRWRRNHAVPILRSASRFRGAGVGASAGGAL